MVSPLAAQGNGISLVAMRILIAVLFLALLSTPAFAGATDPTALGQFGNWDAYYFMDGKNKVCFMSSVPTEQKGIGKKKRGDVLLFVTHWAGENARNVVSVAGGYAYRKGGEVMIDIDGKKFKLFTENEMAWTNNQKTDDDLVSALRKGSRVNVSGESVRGTKTTDVYSLKGSADAYDAISKACDIQE